jgi:tight adherence protein C
MNSPFWLLLGFFSFVLVTVLLAGYVFLGRAGARLPGESAVVGVGGSMVGDMLRSLGESLAHPRVMTGEIQMLLQRCGYRGPGAAVAYQGALWSSVALFGVLLGVCGLVAQRSISAGFVAAICGFGVGFMMPKRVLEHRAKARSKRISRGLPTALDLLLLNIEAGRGLDQSMLETSRGTMRGYPELAEELNQACLELNAGGRRSDVLLALAERSGDLEMRKLVALLVDTDRFGTSLAPALRSHAKYLRTRRRQKAQETARKLTVKLVFPVFFLIFPSILLVTLGPAVIAMFSQLLPMLTGSK